MSLTAVAFSENQESPWPQSPASAFDTTPESPESARSRPAAPSADFGNTTSASFTRCGLAEAAGARTIATSATASRNPLTSSPLTVSPIRKTSEKRVPRPTHDDNGHRRHSEHWPRRELSRLDGVVRLPGSPALVIGRFGWLLLVEVNLDQRVMID